MNKDLTYTVLQVDGMSCSNCANGIQKHLTKKGLSNCHVSFANAEVSVYHNNNWTKESLISEIESIGFKAKDNSVKSINYDLERNSQSVCFSPFLFLHTCSWLRSIFYKIQLYKLFFAFRCLS